MSGVQPPIDALSSDDIGGLVIVVCFALAAVSLLVGIVHFSLAVRRSLTFGFDDTTYVLANVSAIASTVLWRLAVSNGLGQRMSALTPDSIDKFFKFEYAAQLIEIVSMLCAKLSMALLLNRVAPRKPWAKISTLVAITAWAIFSIFALAFQCPLPHPWVFQPAQCPTHGNLLYPIIIFNALTDIVLALGIVPNVWNLQMIAKDRNVVMMLFGLRISVIFPVVVELALMHLFLNTADQTWITVYRVILNQITVYISVICASIPRTNPVLSQLNADRAWTMQVLDFEILDAGRQSEPKPEQPLRLVPPTDSVLSTTVYSGTSEETRAESPSAITIRRDIFVKEKNKHK